jgi:histone deacetylase complex subunit SAP18
LSAYHNLTDFPVAGFPGGGGDDRRDSAKGLGRLPQHVEIYTWMDCTLRELAMLLTGAVPGLLRERERDRDRSGEVVVGTRLGFRCVYPDLGSGGAGGGRNGAGGGYGRLDGEGGRGRYVSREMGSVVVSAPGTEEEEEGGVRNGAGAGYELGGEDADKTLEDARFVIGDFVDVAVFPPLGDGSVVGRGAVMGGAGGYRGRENGYSSRGGRGGGGGAGFGAGRGRGGDFGPPIPAGEWRRGERLPDSGYGRGRGRGRY